MTTCHCDGPPHEYDPSWCITPKFDSGYVPRNHGGLGESPTPPVRRIVGTEFTPGHSMNILEARRAQRDFNNVMRKDENDDD